jgi:hypothetical protein
MPCPKCQSNNTVQSKRGPHIGEYCADCGAHIRWVPQGLENFIWPVGTKHKGKRILDILKTDRRYLEWAAENISIPGLCKKAQEALQYSQGPQTTPTVPLSQNKEKQCLPGACATCTKECHLLEGHQGKKPLRPPSSDDRAPWE